MTKEQFRKRLMAISVAAGMNQRYHQERAYRWWRWDAGAKIVTAVFAVVSLALAIVSAAIESWSIDYSGAAIAFVAAFAAIVLNVFPFGAWQSSNDESFHRWSELRECADGLEFENAAHEASDELIGKLKELDAKFHRLCSSESLADRWLWEKCQNEELRSRGLPLISQREPVPLPERIRAVFKP